MWLIFLTNMRQYDTFILLDDILEMGNLRYFTRKPGMHAWSSLYASALAEILFSLCCNVLPSLSPPSPVNAVLF
jgi:hypothetical protein